MRLNSSQLQYTLGQYNFRLIVHVVNGKYPTRVYQISAEVTVYCVVILEKRIFFKKAIFETLTLLRSSFSKGHRTHHKIKYHSPLKIISNVYKVIGNFYFPAWSQCKYCRHQNRATILLMIFFKYIYLYKE